MPSKLNIIVSKLALLVTTSVFLALAGAYGLQGNRLLFEFLLIVALIIAIFFAVFDLKMEVISRLNSIEECIVAEAKAKEAATANQKKN